MPSSSVFPSGRGAKRPLPLSLTSSTSNKQTITGFSPQQICAGRWIKRSNDPDGGLFFRNESAVPQREKVTSPETTSQNNLGARSMPWANETSQLYQPITSYFAGRQDRESSTSTGRYARRYDYMQEQDAANACLQPSPPRTRDERGTQIHFANKNVFKNPSFRADQVCRHACQMRLVILFCIRGVNGCEKCISK